MSARAYYSDLGVAIPGSAMTGSVSVRCFANPSAHKRDDRNPSCSVNLDTGQWKCFACGAKGSAFDAAVALGRSRSDAAELAKRHDLFATDREQRPAERPASRRGEKKPGRAPTESQLAGWRDALLGNEMLIARLFELRGWTRDAIDALELGYDAAWTGRDGGPVVFPTRDATGRLVGVSHYQPNPEKRAGKKLKAAAGSTRELFPPPETLPASGCVFVLEGEGEAVAMRSLAFAAVAVPGARSWRAEWAARFAGRDVVLIPDLDTEGRELMAQAARDLLPHAASVRVVDMNTTRDDGGDVGDLVRDAAQDGPAELAQARTVIERMADEAVALTQSDVEAPRTPESGRRVTFTPASHIRHERVRWAWRGRVPLGAVTTFAGQQGLGKSTTTIELAARVTRGELDGDLAGQPSAVLIVTLEDHVASVVKPRLLAAGADLDRVQIVGVEVDGLDGLITLPDDICAIEAGVQEHDARLLIVDPVVAALSGGIDAYRDHDVRRAFAPLAQLAERCDLAVVAIMHLTKAQTGDLLARVSGSVAFTAAARSVIAFARDPDDPEGDTGDNRVIVHAKSNWGKLAPSLLARIEERHVDVDPPTQASRLVILGESHLTAEDFAGGRQDRGDRADRDAAADLIAVELADGDWHPAGSVEAVAKASDISRSTLYRAARALESEGLLERERSGFPPRSMWRSRRSSQPPETNGESDAWDERETPITAGSLAPSFPRSSHVREGETNGAHEVVSGDQIVARIIRDFDAIELADDCANPLGHARHHEPHPDTRRTVCGLCHPPAATLVRNGSRR